MSVADLQAALSSPGANNALTRATLTSVPTGSGGTVRIALADPAELAAQAGLSREAYALARCIRSEGYGGDPIGRAAAAVAIGQAICNGAARARPPKTIEEKLTYSTFVAARGYFGEQAGRFASTTLDPTQWTGEVAQAVLDGGGLPDLARGGYHFLDMKVFASGEQAGRPLGALSSKLHDWMIDEGCPWLGPIPTVDTYHLTVFGPPGADLDDRKAQLDQLLAVYEAGKAGQSGPEGGDPDTDLGGGGLQALLVVGFALGVAYLINSQGWM